MTRGVPFPKTFLFYVDSDQDKKLIDKVVIKFWGNKTQILAEDLGE